MSYTNQDCTGARNAAPYDQMERAPRTVAATRSQLNPLLFLLPLLLCLVANLTILLLGL